MKCTKRIMVVALALICALGITIVAPESAHAYSGAPGTGITFERAIEIARNAAGGGQVKEVEWELKNGNPRYEVEVYFNGRKHEIRINAVTGELTKHTSKATSKTITGITISQVTSAVATGFADIALTQSGGGTVREVEFELNKNGVLICEIELTDLSGNKHEFKFNASTGEMLRHSSKAPKNGSSCSGTINHLAP